MVVSNERKAMWGRLRGLLFPLLQWKPGRKRKTLENLGIFKSDYLKWQQGRIPQRPTMLRLAQHNGFDWNFIQTGLADLDRLRPLGLEFYLEKYATAGNSKTRFRAFTEVVSKSFQYLQDRFEYAELILSRRTDGDQADVLIHIDAIWVFRFRFYASNHILVETSLLHKNVGRVHFTGEVSEFALAQGVAAIQHHMRAFNVTRKKQTNLQRARDKALKLTYRYNGN